MRTGAPMSSEARFVENIDAMLGQIGPSKIKTLPPSEQREARLYYGLREMSQEIAATHALLQEQQRRIGLLEDAVQALLARRPS
jgi:hypothetical protein